MYLFLTLGKAAKVTIVEGHIRDELTHRKNFSHVFYGREYEGPIIEVPRNFSYKVKGEFKSTLKLESSIMKLYSYQERVTVKKPMFRVTIDDTSVVKIVYLDEIDIDLDNKTINIKRSFLSFFIKKL